MKNWVDPADIVYQEGRPGAGFVAIEDLVQDELAKRWAILAANAPMFTPLSYEVLEQMRVVMATPAPEQL